MDELALLDAVAQAELVRRKKIHPKELVEAAIRRIEAVNPRINAVVTPMFDPAREAAEKPIPAGPFAGVPFLLKDLLASYAGVRMTAGSALMKDHLPQYDSEAVKRFKKAGLIILGKTNTPEFGILPTTEPKLFGPTRNPWDLDRTSGGSSGGSAAAVAAGLVPMAHANDGGGSIRIPSSCCGVFGFKPTRARTPLGPEYGDIFSGLVVEHAVTRSVRDSAALLDAISGPAPGDPYWAPPPKQPFIKEVGADPGRLRIAFTTKAVTGVEVHKDCVRAVQDAAKLLGDLGHEVVEEDLVIDRELLTHAFMTVWVSAIAWSVDDAARRAGREPTPHLVEPLTWALRELGHQRSGSAYLLAVQDLQKISRQVAARFLGYDLWMTPTLALPPVSLGEFEPAPDNPLHGFFRAGEFTPFTPLANITGQPAMSVPLFWNDAGLPIGVQFIGRFGDEATLFRLASQLESARPWAKRRPSVSSFG